MKLKEKRKNIALLSLLLLAGSAVIAFLSIKAIEQESYKDSVGVMFWDITNKTGEQITVMSDYEERQISPGETKRVPRSESFMLNLITNNGEQQIYHTTNHVVHVHRTSDGKLEIRSFVE